MDSQSKEDGEILQNIVDRLISIKVFLPHIVEMAREIFYWRDKYEFKFTFESETGNLTEAESMHKTPLWEETFYQEMVADYRSSCFQYCEILQNELPEFHSEWFRLDEALGKLPVRIHRELSGVRIGCRSWRAYVRKYVILPLEKWPTPRNVIPRKPYLRENWLHYFPQRVDEFLKLMELVDPSDHWDKVVLKIPTFIEDVRIAALELHQPINEVPNGPSNNRHWCWSGRVTKKALTEKPYKLSCRLWEARGRRVSVNILTGTGQIFEGIQSESVLRQGRVIGDFFLEENIPITVEAGSNELWFNLPQLVEV
jgi:hypothetical protein